MKNFFFRETGSPRIPGIHHIHQTSPKSVGPVFHQRSRPSFWKFPFCIAARGSIGSDVYGSRAVPNQLIHKNLSNATPSSSSSQREGGAGGCGSVAGGRKSVPGAVGGGCCEEEEEGAACRGERRSAVLGFRAVAFVWRGEASVWRCADDGEGDGGG